MYIFVCVCACTVKFTVPISSIENDDDLVSIVVISILAVIGTLLLIIIILEAVVLLSHKRRRMSKNDHKPQQHNTTRTGQSQRDHSNEDILSNGTKINPVTRLDIINELYISSKTDSLDHSMLVPSVSGCDVTITPNPAYVIDPNPPQTRKKAEQQYDYDYVESDELANKFPLVGSTTSDGVYDDTVTDPASDEDDDVYI